MPFTASTLFVVDDDALDGESELMTVEDVAFLNQEAMRDLAVRGRGVGTGVMIVSTIGALAWLWVTIRTQQHLQGRGTFTIGGTNAIGDASLSDRIDAIAGTMGALVLSALTFGIGVALS